MRTNIEIDDTLMAEALAATGAVTKREVVEQGLRELIQRRRQLKVLEHRGKFRWDGDLEEMRANRFPDGDD